MPPAPRLRIDPNSPLPVVRQICDNLRVLLTDGQLAPGMPLPPVRRVALELGVHFNTVAEAYRQLAAEGWLEVKRGRGARVIERKTQKPDRTQLSDFRSRLRQLAAQLRAAGVPRARIAGELRALAEALSE